MQSECYLGHFQGFAGIPVEQGSLHKRGIHFQGQLALHLQKAFSPSQAQGGGQQNTILPTDLMGD